MTRFGEKARQVAMAIERAKAMHRVSGAGEIERALVEAFNAGLQTAFNVVKGGDLGRDLEAIDKEKLP
jgi:hypothetical protein